MPELGDRFTGLPTVPVCLQTFRSPWGFRVSVLQETGIPVARLKKAWPAHWHRVRVHGRSGWIAAGVVVWQQGGQVIVVEGANASQAPQSASTLLRVAAGLR